MLTIKNAADIEKMKAAGRLTEDVLKLMAEMAKPGVTTEELDKAAEELIRSRGGSPSCLGYNGYPKTILHVGKRAGSTRNTRQVQAQGRGHRKL